MAGRGEGEKRLLSNLFVGEKTRKGRGNWSLMKEWLNRKVQSGIKKPRHKTPIWGRGRLGDKNAEGKEKNDVGEEDSPN